MQSFIADKDQLENLIQTLNDSKNLIVHPHGDASLEKKVEHFDNTIDVLVDFLQMLYAANDLNERLHSHLVSRNLSHFLEDASKSEDPKLRNLLSVIMLFSGYGQSLKSVS